MGTSAPKPVVARKTGTVPDRGRVRAAGDCPEFSVGREVLSPVFAEQERAEEPDLLTLDLDIDDKPLKEIIGSLCPWSANSSLLLGSIATAC
jgi:hypothetical protein